MRAREAKESPKVTELDGGGQSLHQVVRLQSQPY